MTFLLAEVAPMKALSFFAVLLICFPNLQASPQVSTPVSSNDIQAISLLTQSAAKLKGNAALSDVTLSGTARRIVGSDDDAGTVTLKALSTASARLDFTFASGATREVRNNLTTGPVGSWCGSDGALHPLAYHNVLTDPSWFFPVFAVNRVLNGNQNAIVYMGRETRNGEVVEHVSVSQSSSVPLLVHLSHVDYFLDSSTLLPSTIAFNTHADGNALLDIPVEISLSDYRTVDGVQVPFHIQKFLNGSLFLDIQLSSVTFNSGLQASDFAVQ
jgi:hypothetical protein